jgi:hypothetical protein
MHDRRCGKHIKGCDEMYPEVAFRPDAEASPLKARQSFFSSDEPHFIENRFFARAHPAFFRALVDMVVAQQVQHRMDDEIAASRSTVCPYSRA